MAVAFSRAVGCRILVALSFLALIHGVAGGVGLQAADPLKASIEKEVAWTGQPVPLIITLYSPGPFEGTAAFDFPELPKTAMIAIGNPVVGSEEVGDDSFLTQRHEFSISTQQTGTVVLPPFSVRFRGKESFVGDAKDVVAKTPKLQFESKRPPGTESLGIVVTTEKVDTQQKWDPRQSSDSNDPNQVQAGDVIERTITRRVSGCSAMLLPPVGIQAPEGVQVYSRDPVVEDKIDRGELKASRTETIKYQFQRAGTFTLPEITFRWWDPKSEKLQEKTLEGTTVEVAAPPQQIAAADGNAEKSGGDKDANTIPAWAVAFGLLIVAGLLYRPLKSAWNAWQVKSRSQELMVAREVRSACRANDAPAAYAALLQWCGSRSSDEPVTPSEVFGEPWERLSAHLYGATGTAKSWSGESLLIAFEAARKQRQRRTRSEHGSALPSLNP